MPQERAWVPPRMPTMRGQRRRSRYWLGTTLIGSTRRWGGWVGWEHPWVAMGATPSPPRAPTFLGGVGTLQAGGHQVPVVQAEPVLLRVPHHVVVGLCQGIQPRRGYRRLLRDLCQGTWGHGEGTHGASWARGDAGGASQGCGAGGHGDVGMGHTGVIGTWGWGTWGRGTRGGGRGGGTGAWGHVGITGTRGRGDGRHGCDGPVGTRGHVGVTGMWG